MSLQWHLSNTNMIQGIQLVGVRTCRDAYRDRSPAMTGKGSLHSRRMRTRNFAYLARGPFIGWSAYSRMYEPLACCNTDYLIKWNDRTSNETKLGMTVTESISSVPLFSWFSLEISWPWLSIENSVNIQYMLWRFRCSGICRIRIWFRVSDRKVNSHNPKYPSRRY